MANLRIDDMGTNAILVGDLISFEDNTVSKRMTVGGALTNIGLTSESRIAVSDGGTPHHRAVMMGMVTDLNLTIDGKLVTVTSGTPTGNPSIMGVRSNGNMVGNAFKVEDLGTPLIFGGRTNANGGTEGASVLNELLLETGGNLLLEDGGLTLLEQ